MVYYSISSRISQDHCWFTTLRPLSEWLSMLTSPCGLGSPIGGGPNQWIRVKVAPQEEERACLCYSASDNDSVDLISSRLVGAIRALWVTHNSSSAWLGLENIEFSSVTTAVSLLSRNCQDSLMASTRADVHHITHELETHSKAPVITMTQYFYCIMGK